MPAEKAPEQRIVFCCKVSTGSEILFVPAHRLNLLKNPDAVATRKRGQRPEHEWVYNRADIDRAMIIWARPMGPERDKDLAQYFSNRSLWLVEADEADPTLLPHPGWAGKSPSSSHSLSPAIRGLAVLSESPS